MLKTDVVALLGKTFTPALAEDAVRRHASGESILEGPVLAMYYANELTNRATKPANKNYEIFASVLAEYLKHAFMERLDKLTKVGAPRVLLMGSRRASLYTQYRTVQVADIRAKLPMVIEKIHSGDLTRFVHLITSNHAYGVCVLCGQLGQFTLLGPLPGKMRLLMDATGAMEEAGHYVGNLAAYSAPFAAIVGFCWQDVCTPHCSDCAQMAPVRYDPTWVKFRKEDGLCPTCAAKMLINTQRPTFGRREQRRLRKLVID